MIIKRYLAKEVFTLGIGLSVLCVFVLLITNIIRYSQAAADGQLIGSTILQLLALQIPQLLTLLLPLGFYFAILLAYGRLHADSEMVVLSSCGFGRRHLTRITLGFMTIVGLVVAIMMFWLNPKLSAYQQEVLKNVDDTVLLQAIVPGRFHQSLDNKHIFYVERTSRDNTQMDNVFMASLPELAAEDRVVWDIMFAKYAYQHVDEETGEHYIVNEDGRRYFGNPGELDYRIIKFGRYQQRIPSQQVEFRRTHYDTVSTWNLLKSMGSQVEGVQYVLAMSELQWRLAIPIAAIVLGLIAVPLSKVQVRQGRYAKMIPAILIFIVYLNLIFISRTWIDDRILSPWVGMWWVHGIFLLLGLGLYVDKFSWRRFLK